MFAGVLFGGRNFYYRDLFIYHFPMKKIVRDAMLSGEFPFWNRAYSNGQPLAANPAYELFYPPQWLILIGSYPFGFALHIVFHVYAALIGMFAMLRAMALGRAASLFGAVSFGIGGLLLGSMTMLPTFFVWALSPWLGWAIVRVMRDATPSRIAIAALVAGMQLVIGEPVALAQVWLLIAVATIVFARHRIVPVAIVLAIALCVAAVQLIPAIDHAHDSARSRGIAFDVVRQYSMPPIRPIEIVVPHFFGMFDPFKNAYWGAGVFDRDAPYLYSIYNGIGVAIFALAGFLLRARGSVTVAGLFIASYVLAIGDRTPLLRALYDAGVARSIRYPEKFIAFGIVALTIFAAVIADRVFSTDAAATKAALVAAAVVTLIAGGIAATAEHRIWLIGFATALLATVLVRVAPRCIVILAVVDLLFVANDLVTTMRRDYFTPPETVRLFDPDRSAYAVMHRGDWYSNTENFHRLRAAYGPWFVRSGLEPFTPAAWGLRTALELDFDETALLPTHDLLDAMMRVGNSGDPLWAEKFAWISNVRYLIDFKPYDPLRRGAFIRLTRLPSTGRYYFAQRTGRVVNAQETSNTATIVVACTAPAKLIATVTRHKYWHVSIDRREVRVLPANIAYQAVDVPAGRHTIVMRYFNPVVLWSGIVSALAVVACAITAMRRPRRPLQTEP